MAISPHPSATAAPVVLAVRDLVKRYGEAVAVGGIAFELHKGEVLTLLGHSGCGKSTTLRMAAGLEEPDGGVITLRGAVVAEPARGTFVPVKATARASRSTEQDMPSDSRSW